MKNKLANFTDKILEYCFYAIIIFIPISKAVIETSIVIALVFFIIKKILNPDFKFLAFPGNIFLLLFLVFSSLSMINSGQYLAISIRALFCKWLEYVFLLIFVYDYVSSNTKKINNVIFIFLATSAVVAIDALLQKITGHEFLRHQSMRLITKGMPAITGPFGHFNDFGTYLICALSLSITMLLKPGSRVNARIRMGILTALLLTCLLFTFSRGSWVSFTGMLFLLLMLTRKYKVLFVIFCLFITALLLTPILKERVAFTFQAGGDGGRFAMWHGAWLMIKARPFLGEGLGTFMSHFGECAPELKFIYYAHNCYLQIWAETGIFALISFLGFLFYILYRSLAIFKKTKDFALLGFFCATFGYSIHSFFDTPLYALQLAVLFWTLAGILTAYISHSDASTNFL